MGGVLSVASVWQWKIILVIPLDAATLDLRDSFAGIISVGSGETTSNEAKMFQAMPRYAASSAPTVQTAWVYACPITSAMRDSILAEIATWNAVNEADIYYYLLHHDTNAGTLNSSNRSNVNGQIGQVFGTSNALTDLGLVVMASNAVSSIPEVYVSPNGGDFCEGTTDNPLNLKTALSAYYAGVDIILKDGDYSLSEQSHWDISNRTIRAENLWQAKIDTRIYAPNINGDNGELIGIVFDSSETKRLSAYIGSNPLDMNYAGRQINLNASNSLYRHCVFKNLLLLGFFTPATGSALYGSHFYYMGWMATDRAHGHNLYVQNDTGTRLIKHCVLHDSFGWGIHAYEGDIGDDITNIHLIENMSFRSGSLHTAKNDILIGHDNASEISIAPIIHRNLAYGGNIGINFYNARVTDVTLTDNYMPNGKSGNYTALEESGNNFTTVGNTSFLFADEYEDGTGTYGKKMAYLTIYNEANANTVEVDVSAVYANGDIVNVHNSQDMLNDVQELTVTGGMITVNMQASNRTVETPSGWPAPATTFPTFGCFILRKQ